MSASPNRLASPEWVGLPVAIPIDDQLQTQSDSTVATVILLTAAVENPAIALQPESDPSDPYPALALQALNKVVPNRRHTCDVRESLLIEAAFGPEPVPTDMRTAFLHAVGQLPGSTATGNGMYKIKKPKDPQPKRQIAISTETHEQQAQMANLVAAVVSHIRPGPPFSFKLCVGIATTLTGANLTPAEINMLEVAFIQHPHIKALEDGQFKLLIADGALQPTPRESLGAQAEVKPARITRTTLDGMIKAALQPRVSRADTRRPNRRKKTENKDVKDLSRTLSSQPGL